MKSILILGGTGAIGESLVKILTHDKKYLLTVTSRTKHISDDSVTYICGNAKEIDFLCPVLHKKWDIIVDFMTYGTDEFMSRAKLLLQSTDQYVYISSARVYADFPDKYIKEDYPRLIDVCIDIDYLKTDEYALAKARQEDYLKRIGDNWTIIRPSITYSNTRLQLGVLEKENWIYRALHGRTIVFSKDIADKYTTMSTSEDVAKGIIAILANNEALGETYNITSSKAYSWSEIFNIYLSVLEEYLGRKVNVIWTDKSTNLQFEDLKYQVIYGRYFSRHFDNTKIAKLVDTSQFMDPKLGLEKCLREFLIEQKFRKINWKIEAINDRIAREKTKMSEIPSLHMKLRYFIFRYNFQWILKLVKLLTKHKR